MPSNRHIAYLLLVAQVAAALCLNAKEINYGEIIAEFGLIEVAATLDEPPIAETSTMAHSENRNRVFLERIGVAGTSVDSIRDHLQTDPIFRVAAEAESLAASGYSEASLALEEILQEGMVAGINTGYNVIAEDAWPNYAPDRSIIYGHNQIKHMRQLLFLLRIHGLEPRFEIVPKRSAFKLREGWGNTTEATPRLPDGTPVAIISEYDLLMEFATPEEVLHFQELITRYAKKDADDEQGLIYKSWWQPFYRSFVPSGDMRRTREIWVSKNGFKANVLSIPAQAKEKENSLRNLSDAWSIEVIDLWVNPSFYRYLLGDYK